MNLDQITVLVLTYNESANIHRCLFALRWASKVIVVDSNSTDETQSIAESFPNVQLVRRAFDNHTNQWNFGLSLINTQWALCLDADYICPAEFTKELTSVPDGPDAFYAAFEFRVFGVPLRSTLYPARPVLFRTGTVIYYQDGHTQQLDTSSLRASFLKSKLHHDDRKPLSRWLSSQIRYSVLEADKLLSAPRGSLGWKDSIRTCMILAPFLTAVYCLIWKRLILDGRAGWYYTFQRVLAETMLSLELLDRKLRVLSGDETSRKM